MCVCLGGGAAGTPPTGVCVGPCGAKAKQPRRRHAAAPLPPPPHTHTHAHTHPHTHTPYRAGRQLAVQAGRCQEGARGRGAARAARRAVPRRRLRVPAGACAGCGRAPGARPAVRVQRAQLGGGAPTAWAAEASACLRHNHVAASVCAHGVRRAALAARYVAVDCTRAARCMAWHVCTQQLRLGVSCSSRPLHTLPRPPCSTPRTQHARAAGADADADADADAVGDDGRHPLRRGRRPLPAQPPRAPRPADLQV
jgi:hypothetical protein